MTLDQPSAVAGRKSETARSSGKRRTLFFQGIAWRKAIGLTLILAILASVSHSLSDMNLHQDQTFPWMEFLEHLYRYAACAFLGWVFAQKTGFQPFLTARPSAWLGKGRQLVIFGVLPGAAIGLTYHRVFAPYRFSPRIPLYLREMDGYYDSFILSLRAAVTEELIFRFFLLAAFYYILTRISQPLMDRGLYRLRWLLVLLSFVLSGWLFGLAHGSFGFATAFLAGVLLGGIFWRSGFETAVVSHFVADFIFFNLTYVSG